MYWLRMFISNTRFTWNVVQIEKQRLFDKKKKTTKSEQA